MPDSIITDHPLPWRVHTDQGFNYVWIYDAADECVSIITGTARDFDDARNTAQFIVDVVTALKKPVK